MQSVNPLFPTSDDQPQDTGYISLRSQKVITPPSQENSGATTETAGTNEALLLIRNKLARIYAEEPNAQIQQVKAEQAKPRSKHQEYMHQLQTSGKSLAEIQTAWHQYYTQLPDAEKHQVWQEFYEANSLARQQQPASPQPQYQPLRLPSPSLSQAFMHPQVTLPQVTLPTIPNPAEAIQKIFPVALPKRPAFPQPAPVQPTVDNRTPAQLREVIRSKVTANGRIGLKHHLQSLSFGLAVGFITLVIALFGLFNEVVIAPFIQPGRMASATPIIVDPSSVAATTNPEIIIPKINLEIPVDYTQRTDEEEAIQGGLEKGIVHYPSTVMPGQNGNSAFFGHSSNNIFNPGKYKFAFVLLHEVQPGDTFYLTKDGKTYIYKVFDRKVVDPSDISVLNNVPGHVATATLITCDPPGTTLHRLVVIGDQISPDPATNGAGSNTVVPPTVTELPDNGPSWWQQLWNSIF